MFSKSCAARRRRGRREVLRWGASQGLHGCVGLVLLLHGGAAGLRLLLYDATPRAVETTPVDTSPGQRPGELLHGQRQEAGGQRVHAAGGRAGRSECAEMCAAGLVEKKTKEGNERRKNTSQQKEN